MNENEFYEKMVRFDNKLIIKGENLDLYEFGKKIKIYLD